MIISSDGQVLTNNHVIDGATSIRVVTVSDGANHTAKVLGYDVVDDVALLKIDDVSGLTPITFADPSTVQIGDAVVAIGNAGGRGGTPVATTGSITALDQKVTAGDAGTGDSETLHGMIQISAPIEPGDSGGPLADSEGNIIGMNTAAAQSNDFTGQSGSTTAFAIPIEKARAIASQIQAGKDSDTVHVGDRGILGVQVRNLGDGGTSSPAGSGAAIVGVEENGPAAAVGIVERRRDHVDRGPGGHERLRPHGGDVPVPPRRRCRRRLGRRVGHLAQRDRHPHRRPARPNATNRPDPASRSPVGGR